MTSDSFYWYAGILIFLPWLFLILAPSWKHTERIAFGAAFLLLLAAAYFTAFYLFSEGGEQGSLLSLEGLKNLFRNKEMLLTGWLNYLSFSLFAGTWQVHDARQLKIPHIWVAPALLVTMLAGPTGLLLYLLVRWIKTRKWEVN